MPAGTFFGMQHLNSNLLCAVATQKVQHQLYSVACIPIDSNLEMHKEILLFDMQMKPLDRDAIERGAGKPLYDADRYARVLLQGYENEDVADKFYEWFKQIGLKPGKKIMPVCHDWFEQGSTLKNWLGIDVFDRIFDNRVRDVQLIANFINDNYDARAEPVPYSKTDFRWIAKAHYVESHEARRNALDDARQLVDLYKSMVKRGLPSTFDCPKLQILEETHL